MKNISENRRGKFEQAWQDAFDGKEMSPTPDLWQNLDRHLANQESKKYRRGIFVYKWIAAASIVIALMVSGIYFYNTYTTSSQQISKVQPGDETIDEQNDTNTENNQVLDNTPDIPQPTFTDNYAQSAAKSTNPGGDGKVETNTEKGSDKIIKSQGQAIASSGKKDDHAGNPIRTPLDYVKDTDQPAVYSPHVTELAKTNNSQHVNMLTAKGAQLNHLEPEVAPLSIQKVINFEDDPFRKKADEMFEENLWAGVNMSSGYFDPNFGSERGGSVASELSSPMVGFMDNESVSPASVSQDNSGGQSFTFGFNMGKRIAKRWVLQSGINYLNYSSDGSTNAFYKLSDQTRAPASSSFNFENAESLNLASSVINFDNQFEFLSVPVKAGYVLLDKKMSLVLSAGVGTDFFLNNRVSSDSDGLQDFSVKPGEDSPYRTVYFNGLMGTQLRYRFSKHYSFTFEPTYSVAINSFSKSDNDLNSFPNVFRIGVGLKYHFR